MSLHDDLSNETQAILTQAWNLRDGNVVPYTENVVLAGGGVNMTPTMLYADMADSTMLAGKFDRRVAAKVVKAFLAASCRIIRAHDGHIRSFDGDRVMGVFIGNRQNTRAATAALQINYAVRNIIRPKIEGRYPVLLKGGYTLRHCVGIDRSETLVVRSGVREHNDLIWIGRAPNIAAKLANLREDGYATYITDTVFRSLADDGKYGGTDSQLMWEKRNWPKAPFDEVRTIHRSRWTWRP